MNILICSVGTRNKIVQYFRKALQGNGRVIAADMSELAPAVYEADQFYVVPSISDETYMDIILAICGEEKISAVLSLIDPEQSLLARNSERFLQAGVKVIGSSYEICERCLNKWHMYSWLNSHGYKCAKTYMEKEAFYRDGEAGAIKYPVFIKPVCGSASIAVLKAFNQETVEFLFTHRDDLLIQQYMEGQEIGVDAYIDMVSHKLVSVFTKKKIAMRAGETDKSVSFKDQRLFELIDKFVSDFGFEGPIDIDLFDIGGEYYISEVNPRFGGGYPHAYECGCDHMKLIINNLLGIPNQEKIGMYQENIYMMKYNGLMIKQDGGVWMG